MPQVKVTSHILAARTDFGVLMHYHLNKKPSCGSITVYMHIIYVHMYPLIGICSGAHSFVHTYNYSHIQGYIFYKKVDMYIATYIAHTYVAIHFTLQH